MRREELRTGRIADMEFQAWECWECDANVPGAPPERHWFRSDTGMEAPTYDHMLQKLYRRALGLEMPVLQDDLAIQMVVTNICRKLANETMDPKRATSLLYGIQVASVAVRRAMQNRRFSHS